MRIKTTFRQKKILDCIIKDGLTQTQTAKRLGCTANNVCSIIHRLMKKYPELKLNVYEKQYQNYEIPQKFVRVDRDLNVTNIKQPDVTSSQLPGDNYTIITDKNDNFIAVDEEEFG